MNLRRFHIKPSWRKTFSDLWGNKVRTLLVVASIAVGVFAVGMIAGAYMIIPADMNSSFSSANPANIIITTAPFDEELIDSISRVEGVQSAQGQRKVTVRLNTGGDTWTSLELVAPSDFSPSRIDVQNPISGQTVPAKDQVILEKRTAVKYGIHPGDVLQIELQDGVSRFLPVAGVAQDLTSGVGGMMDNAKGYLLADTLEWLHEPRLYTQLLVTVSGQPDDSGYITAVSRSVSDKIEKSGREIYQTDLARRNQHPMESILQALLSILMVLGILIVFLSGSLISNTLSALLNQHLGQIGIMKLVGARRFQIIRMYLTLILAFGLIALVIAVPAGAWAAFALSGFAAGLIGFPIRSFEIIPQAVAAQAVIALAVPLLAGSLPVLTGARVTVKKAITASSLTGEQSGKHSLIDRWLAGLRGLSRPALISLRNTFRRKGRLALTLLTLTLGGAIFISVFNVQVSLNTKIEQITHYFGADVNLDFNRVYSVEQVTALAAQVPGVAEVEPWAVAQADVLDRSKNVLAAISILAPPAGSQMVTPILMQGRWIMPGDQGVITVNEAFLRRFPGLKVGDSLFLDVGGRKADWKVVGIFQFTGTDDLIAYASYDDLSRVLNQPGRTAAFRIRSQDHSLQAQTAVSQQLDAFFRQNGFKVNKSEAGGAFTSSMVEYIGILTAFLLVMALLTAVVGSIGMAGTLSMNVMERTREIGVLRAIGAHDRVILRLVLMEGLVIGLISFVFAALLSFPISTLLAELISQAIFSAPADFAFTAQGFGIWLAVVLLLSAVASLIPARSASRMTIREVLAYE